LVVIGVGAPIVFVGMVLAMVHNMVVVVHIGIVRERLLADCTTKSDPFDMLAGPTT
jgi:hypothetical protein